MPTKHFYQKEEKVKFKYDIPSKCKFINNLHYTLFEWGLKISINTIYLFLLPKCHRVKSTVYCRFSMFKLLQGLFWS